MFKYSFTMLIMFLLNAFIAKDAIGQSVTDLNQLETFNRKAEIIKAKDKNAIVKLDARENDGTAWIKSSNFKNGTIEVDIQGKDVVQQSFVGIAFHKKNSKTYEVVYLRPFNFNSPNALNQSHQIQYTCLPNYDWKILREKHPGIYEHKLNKTVLPNDWVHVKIIVNGKSILAFINNESNPSLSVTALQGPMDGEVGFWVGNNSDGKFRNLVVNKTK
ncbi:MAG: hypothetical protein PW786_05475 [Arachidicoccus sp.]|nr:hypothetical protein [Arachidicoccus sp.]